MMKGGWSIALLWVGAPVGVLREGYPGYYSSAKLEGKHWQAAIGTGLLC